MKRKKALSFLVVVAAVVAAHGVGADEDAVRLRLNLQSGESYYSYVTVVQKSAHQGGPGGDASGLTVERGLEFAVKEVSPEGVHTVEVTFERIKANLQSPRMRAEYDSENPPDSVPVMLRTFAALAGKTLVLEIDSSGRVLKVEGTDKLIAAIMEGSGGKALFSWQQLESEFGEAALKRRFGEWLEIYPDKPVRVGDSWTRERALPVPVPITTQVEMELTGRQGGIAELHVTTEAVTGEGGEMVQAGPAKIRYDMEAHGEGTLRVKETTGWIVEGRLTQKVEGDREVRPPGSEAMNIPISAQVTTTITNEPPE